MNDLGTDGRIVFSHYETEELNNGQWVYLSSYATLEEAKSMKDMLEPDGERRIRIVKMYKEIL